MTRLEIGVRYSSLTITVLVQNKMVAQDLDGLATLFANSVSSIVGINHFKFYEKHYICASKNRLRFLTT